MLLRSLSRFQENQPRLRQILAVLGKYGLADWLATTRASYLRQFLGTTNGKRLDQFSREERIRLALQELGTTFIKLGQMLSTRLDLVGPALAAELSKLQTSAPAEPIEVVRHTIQLDLGKAPEELFAEFQPEALASASIGQVHRARLCGGEAVVVKIRHANIEATVRRDLDLMQGLAELAQKHAPAFRNYRPVTTVKEFRRRLLNELDLQAERRNVEEFARRFADDPGVRFPRTYPEWSGRRVLTMELLEGIPGGDAGKASSAIERAQFARRAAKMYLDMIFRDGFFHADPHPGNYLILPNGVVGVLDCGMVGRLEEGLRVELEGAVQAVAERDVGDLLERVVRLGAPPPDLDRQALRADLAEYVAEYTSRPIKELDMGAALREMFDIIARYHIRLPANTSLLLRTIMVLEGSARQLDPSFSLMDVIVEYWSRSRQRRLAPRRWWRETQRAAAGYERLLRLMPDDLADILHRLRSGTLEVRHEHRHLQASVHRLIKGLLTAALLLSAAMLLSLGDGALPRILLGVTCLIAAAWLGYRLLRSIAAAERDLWE